MSSYCLFIEFLVVFLRCFKGFSKEEEAFTAYILVKAYINLCSSTMLLVRVLSKGK
jgi:predicted metal-binding protein